MFVFFEQYKIDLNFFERPEVILSILITLWAVRLTRRAIKFGFYNLKHEDYRWAYIRQKYSLSVD